MLKTLSKTSWFAAALAALACSPMAAAAAPPVSAVPPSAAQEAPTQLDRFLKHLKTLQVSFHQTLVDAHGVELSHSSGTLIVERPGRFRWDIRPLAAQGSGSGTQGAGQLMVGDGRNVWFYDRDLQQVTVRPVNAALSATPAMLLSGAVDVHAHFKEQSAGERDGLDWVFVEPLDPSGADFRDALFGFKHGTLQRMILEDTLGQEATVIFDHVEVNRPVAAKLLTFSVPAGVDVIGTPAR